MQPLEVGDEVLVLLPTKENKLQLQWSGPYQITRRVTPVDYKVKRPGCRQEMKVYHANLLKKWHPSSSSSVLFAISTEDAEDTAELDTEYLLETSSNMSSNSQQLLSPAATSHLTTDQATEIKQLLQAFPEVVGTQLGRTTATEHTVNVGDTPPIRQHPYIFPLAMREMVKKGDRQETRCWS